MQLGCQFETLAVGGFPLTGRETAQSRQAAVFWRRSCPAAAFGQSIYSSLGVGRLRCGVPTLARSRDVPFAERGLLLRKQIFDQRARAGGNWAVGEEAFDDGPDLVAPGDGEVGDEELEIVSVACCAGGVSLHCQ